MAYSAFGINYDTAAKIGTYAGDASVPAQPVWAEDTHQLWIVHGTSGKYRIAMASELSGYLTTADASKTYLGINAKAKSAEKADSATTAASATSVPWTGVTGRPAVSPITSGTTDLTAGTSPLETGAVYLVYE